MGNFLLLMSGVVACFALHEAAHALAAEWLGLPVTGIAWHPPLGIGLRVWPGPHWKNYLVAAAGPAMSLFLAWAIYPFNYWLALGNAVFGILNLVLANSDGSRMLKAFNLM